MQSRRQTKKSHMKRVLSDDEGSELPQKKLSIPSTQYELLPSGNLSSSSQILHVSPVGPELNASDSPVTAHGDPGPTTVLQEQLDFAYLEHLNDDFVSVKRKRTYVSTKCILSLFHPEDVCSSLTRLKGGLLNVIHCSQNFCGGREEAIICRVHVIAAVSWMWRI